MSVLGLVPCRGGSKGIPRKNVREVAGEPLLAHTVRASRDAGDLPDVLAGDAFRPAATGDEPEYRHQSSAGETSASPSRVGSIDSLSSKSTASVASTILTAASPSPYSVEGS